jgi:hypothetical protein
MGTALTLTLESTQPLARWRANKQQTNNALDVDFVSSK